MPQRSYIEYSENCDFPLENLPYGVFSTADDNTPRIGVAIGDLILDLKKTENIFTGPLLRNKIDVFKQPTLNDFMALDRSHWKEARESLQSYLSIDRSENAKKGIFIKQNDAQMRVPVTVGDYSDFFSSYYHAYNCSLIAKIDMKINWRYIPIAYHGRSSTIFVSGTAVRRPVGQFIEDLNNPIPTLQPTKRLDFELEVGVFVGGRLNKPGQAMKIDDVEECIFGMVLLNDWSARDVQLWEMVPLGPFLSKNFATTVSPWIVTMEALEAFKTDNMIQDPVPLPYLQHKDRYNYDIVLESYLRTKDFKETKLCETNYKYLYWTAKQQLCHHTITGCQMRPGDLMGSGTISGPTANSCGCLFELTSNGNNSIKLTNGQMRTFLEDGDEIILTGYCCGNGYRIGFGKCEGRILPVEL